MAILETKNLTYTYGVGTPFEKTAVENVNLSVEKGAFVGVIGHTAVSYTHLTLPTIA